MTYAAEFPEQLNPSLAETIGRAYAELIHPRRVAVGHDIRETSPELAAALCRGLVESGVDVVDIGLVGTEEVYFATFSLGLDGGVMVTASHNPRDYNGMKFTREKARPISADTGLLDMEQAVMRMLKGEGPEGDARRRRRADGRHHADRHAAGLHRAPSHVRRSGASPAAQDRCQRGQRRRGPGHRPPGDAASFRVRQAQPRARRVLPEWRAQSHADREPHSDRARPW